VIGAPQEDGGAGNPLSNAGSAYVFSRNQGGDDLWGEVMILRASDRQAQDTFGWSTAISGDTILVGAPLEDGGTGNPTLSSGSAYLFTRNTGGANNWGEVRILRASDMQTNDNFGWSVAINSDTAVIGARGEDGGAGNPLTDAGAVYVMTRNQGGADNWGELTILRATDAQASDFFGQSVSLSGSFIAVGASQEDAAPATRPPTPARPTSSTTARPTARPCSTRSATRWWTS
jgi:hypothetical protein